MCPLLRLCVLDTQLTGGPWPTLPAAAMCLLHGRGGRALFIYLLFR